MKERPLNPKVGSCERGKCIRNFHLAPSPLSLALVNSPRRDVSKRATDECGQFDFQILHRHFASQTLIRYGACDKLRCSENTGQRKLSLLNLANLSGGFQDFPARRANFGHPHFPPGYNLAPQFPLRSLSRYPQFRLPLPHLGNLLPLSVNG